MKLFELDNRDFEGMYYDPSEDKINMRFPTDTRKPVLTLAHISQLKKLRALQKLENLKRQDILNLIYGKAPADDGGGGGAPF